MKNILQLLVIVGFFLSLSACSKSSSDPVIKSTAAASEESKEGGITSGGGGVLPANPITLDDFYEVIGSSKTKLRLMVNWVRAGSPEDIGKYFDPSSLDVKYFYGKNNIGTVLEETELEILNDRACKDSSGKDVDGSVYATNPNAICISAFRIIPKISKESASNEILSLIVHELSHKLGASEYEATQLQKMMLSNFQHRTLSLQGLKFRDVVEANEDIIDSLGSIRLELKNGRLYDLKKYYDVIEDKMNILYGSSNLFTEGIPLFDFEKRALDDYIHVLYNTTKLFALENSSKSSDYKNEIDYLKWMFNKADIVSYANIDVQYANQYLSTKYENHKLSSDYGHLNINKILNVDDNLTQLDKLIRYYYELKIYLSISIEDTSPFSEFTSPLVNKINPWSHFVGNYTLNKINCDAVDIFDFSLTEMSIRNDSGLVFVSKTIKTPTKTGKIDDQVYENYGGSLMLFSAVTKINEFTAKNGSGGAERITQAGDRWYNNYANYGYQKITEQMYSENGKSYLKVQYEYYDSPKLNVVAKSNSASCLYQVNHK